MDYSELSPRLGFWGRLTTFTSRSACLLFLVWMLPTGNEAAEPADTNYDETKVPDYVLPALFPEDMEQEHRLAHWKQSRRKEVLTLMEQYVYGRTPGFEVKLSSQLQGQSSIAFGGKARRRQFVLTISPASTTKGLDLSRSIQVEVLIYTPTEAKGPVPAFLGLNFYGNQTVHSDPEIRISQRWMRGNGAIGIVNNRATEKTRGVYSERWQAEMLIERGYGLVTFYCGDIDPDNYRHDFSDGVHPLFYLRGQDRPSDDEWGAIGAWAWGLSQVRAWLEGDSFVDGKRVAVIGHSRLGKTALWAGAQDERFAMVVSNNSGCGGAALYRRCYGERIHHMLKPVGYWFCRDHADFAHLEERLPVDQHMLMALIAPRPLYVASAEEDRWADPKGEFLSVLHASPVYELYGTEGLPTKKMPKVGTPVVGQAAYHVRAGAHDVTEFDWRQYLDFADKHLK